MIHILRIIMFHHGLFGLYLIKEKLLDTGILMEDVYIAITNYDPQKLNLYFQMNHLNKLLDEFL